MQTFASTSYPRLRHLCTPLKHLHSAIRAYIVQALPLLYVSFLSRRLPSSFADPQDTTDILRHTRIEPP